MNKQDWEKRMKIIRESTKKGLDLFWREVYKQWKIKVKTYHGQHQKETKTKENKSVV